MGSHAAPHHHKRILVMVSSLLLVGGGLLGLPRADGAPAPADACRTTATHLPRGDCGPFWQVLAEDFNGDRVPWVRSVTASTTSTPPRPTARA